jgi:type II secretory ATPase GspE/PulE/Tfp pilus assembly ATPase PilB-like protein
VGRLASRPSRKTKAHGRRGVNRPHRRPADPRGFAPQVTIDAAGGSQLRASHRFPDNGGMLSDRNAPAIVTIGHLDGQTKTGRIARFLPASPDVPIEVGGHGPAAPPTRLLLPAEKVAYIAFHRDPREPVPAPKDVELTPMRVHVAGGRSFLVDVPPGASPLGFYAFPSGGQQGPYKEFFFYTHGVNAKEATRLLGDMLMDGGLLNADRLKQALLSQSAQRTVPIGQILLEQRKIDPAQLDQAVGVQARKQLRIGEVLVQAGLATEADIEAALREQKKRVGKKLGEVLVEMNIIPEAAISKTLAKKFHLPFVDLDQCLLNADAPKEIPLQLVSKYGVLPIDVDGKTLTVAISDPTQVDVVDVLRFHAKKQIAEVLVTPSQLKRYVANHLAAAEKAQQAAEMDVILKEIAADEAQSESAEPQVNEADGAIIRLANQLIVEAYRRGASDIHIEPNGRESTVVVRFRVDGDCSVYQELPPAFRQPLVARLKIMSQLDISERRKPQDGKIRFRMQAKPIELRVATIPTVNGNEDVVMRILAGSKPIPLDQMGMAQRNLAELRSLMEKPYGLVLCVGPTGSGKTTTLHSALGSINTNDRKIWTAEDPVEITQPGLRQVQVNAKIGFTFAAAMRAFLRADPDVIMVGEMRDAETAGIAVEASLTGHLVVSTLHTNSAPETLTRLLDMGLDPFSFSDALLGVLAQRLTRALCSSCREPYAPPKPELDALAAAYGGEALLRERLGATYGPDFVLHRAVGCAACGNTGYKGRLGLHELLVTNDGMKLAIARRAPVHEIRAQAIVGGMTTLLQDGIEKVLAGKTDMRQVLGVCSR